MGSTMFAVNINKGLAGSLAQPLLTHKMALFCSGWYLTFVLSSLTRLLSEIENNDQVYFWIAKARSISGKQGTQLKQ